MTKIVFAPGCFEDFVGTQEELNEMIEDITAQLLDEIGDEEYELIEVDSVNPKSCGPIQ